MERKNFYFFSKILKFNSFDNFDQSVEREQFKLNYQRIQNFDSISKIWSNQFMCLID